MKLIIKIVLLLWIAQASLSHAAAPDIFEAEDAEFSRAAVKKGVKASGGAFVDGNDSFKLTWNINVDSEELLLKFQIATPRGLRSMGVFVNDAKVGVVSVSKGGWRSDSVIAKMKVGKNVVELRDSEGTAELNVDYLAIELAPASSLEAEKMELSGAYKAANLDQASNQAVVELTGKQGSVKTYPIGFANGYYDLEVSYFCQSDTNSFFKVRQNGRILDSWVANPQAAAQNGPVKNRVRRIIQQVNFNQGDEFEVTGFSGDGGAAWLDKIALTAVSQVDPNSTNFGLAWNENGSIKNLKIDAADRLGAKQPSGLDFGVFNGVSVRYHPRTDSQTIGNVTELFDTEIKVVRGFLRSDSYKHHLAVRLIELEGVAKNDPSLNFRLRIPYQGNVKVVALDDAVWVDVKNDMIEVYWNSLAKRGVMPRGGVAIFNDGSEQEIQAAMEEIKTTHQFKTQ